MNLRTLAKLAAAALASHLLAATASAQALAPQPGPYARMVVIQPHTGQAAGFEAGYQRHLEWHRGVQDRWTWYGWHFVLGDRLGKFMDGTFFHSADDFDHAVQPAADGADNGKNVEPFAVFESHSIVERLPALSAGAPLPDASAYLSMTTYVVAPEAVGRFEAALRRRVHQRPADDRFSWYRLTAGGDGPAYLLLRAAPSFGAAARLPDWFGPSLRSGYPGDVRRVRSELLRFDPKMSYQPAD